MKVLALAVLALPGVLAAEPCNFGTLVNEPAVKKVLKPAADCQGSSGYMFMPPLALPTEADIKKICDSCQALLEVAKTVTFPTCELKVGSGTIGVDKLFGMVASGCSANPSTAPPSPSSSNPAPSTTAPGPTTTTPKPSTDSKSPKPSASADATETPKPTTANTTDPVTTTAPVATEAPAATSVTAGSQNSASSASAGSTIIDDVTTPATSAPTKTTKAPVPSATASAGATATLGAAITVACSLAALAL